MRRFILGGALGCLAMLGCRLGSPIGPEEWPGHPQAIRLRVALDRADFQNPLNEERLKMLAEEVSSEKNFRNRDVIAEVLYLYTSRDNSRIRTMLRDLLLDLGSHEIVKITKLEGASARMTAGMEKVVREAVSLQETLSGKDPRARVSFLLEQLEREKIVFDSGYRRARKELSQAAPEAWDLLGPKLGDPSCHFRFLLAAASGTARAEEAVSWRRAFYLDPLSSSAMPLTAAEAVRHASVRYLVAYHPGLEDRLVFVEEEDGQRRSYSARSGLIRSLSQEEEAKLLSASRPEASTIRFAPWPAASSRRGEKILVDDKLALARVQISHNGLSQALYRLRLELAEGFWVVTDLTSDSLQSLNQEMPR